MVFAVSALELEESLREGQRDRDRESKSAFILFRSERLCLIYSVVHLVGLIPTTESWLNGMFWWDLGAYHSFHIATSYGRKLRQVGKEGIAVCSTRRNGFIFLGRLWRLWGPIFSTQHSDFHTDVCCACPVAVFTDGLLELCFHSSRCKLRSHFQK